MREVEGTHTSTRIYSHDDLPALGAAPSRWSAARKRLWRELKAGVPWLRESDRVAFRSLVIAEEMLREADEAEDRNPEEVLKWMVQVHKWTAKVGMTSADRTRVPPGNPRKIPR